MENHSHIQKLKYRLLECTTEDSEFPLYELIRGAESSGWMSVRFCTYPQEILLQFLTPVNLKQIHILCNEKKIPSLIEIYCYHPANPQDVYKNYKQASFEKLGYIRMDTNSKTNYKAREFRKIYVDTTCLYLKLVLQKNYVNKYNVFNQVGLINLDFYGTPILYPKNELYLKESLLEKGTEIRDENLDEISQEKLKILKTQLEEALKVEDFDEAKKIKKSVDRVRLIARKIYELETNKKIYISNEDFDNAKIMKFELDRLKSNLKLMDRQLASLVHSQSMNMNLNRSMGENNSSAEDNKDVEGNSGGSGALNNTINYQNQQNFNIDETINKEKSFINENREKERMDRES
jgi:centrosomal protein CEP104